MEKQEQLNNNLRTTKFMTNILVEPRSRTRYVKQLETFTKDAQISFERIIIALLISLVVFMFYFWLAQQISFSTPSSLISYFLSVTAAITIIVLYMLPSRGKSLLQSTIDLGIFFIGEKTRRKISVTLPTLIEHISDDGLIELTDGSYAKIYITQGHMGRSVLPQVVQRASDAKRRNLILTPSTSSQMTVTELKRFDASEQINNHDVAMYTSDDPFVKEMNRIQADFLRQEIHLKSTVIHQYTMVVERSESKLKRVCRDFETSAEEGMLSTIEAVTDRKKIVELVGPLTNYQNIQKPVVDNQTPADNQQ